MVWLLVGLLGAIDFALLSVILVSRQTLPAQSIFQGTLYTSEPADAIILPADVPFKEIRVQEGTTVAAGDLLVTFDTAALQKRADEVGRAILGDTLLRDCLLTGDFSAPPQSGPDTPPPPLTEETRSTVLTAIQDCRADYDTTAQNTARVTLAQRAVAQDTALTQREKALSLSMSGPRTARLQAALNLQRVLGRLDTQAAALAIEADRIATAARVARLSRVRDLGRQIGIARQQLAALGKHLSAPGLLAPRAGQVIQVRALTPGRSVPQDVQIIELAPAATSGQAQTKPVRVTLAPEVADILQPHDRVVFELGGLGGEVMQLSGAVVGITRSEPGIGPSGSIVLVELDLKSQEWLVSADGIPQLARGGVATEIKLQQGAEPFVVMLQRIWRQATHLEDV
jgi:multidrug efflux pump subunit AcrA (membrane-fusion protein)